MSRYVQMEGIVTDDSEPISITHRADTSVVDGGDGKIVGEIRFDGVDTDTVDGISVTGIGVSTNTDPMSLKERGDQLYALSDGWIPSHISASSMDATCDDCGCTYDYDSVDSGPIPRPAFCPGCFEDAEYLTDRAVEKYVFDDADDAYEKADEITAETDKEAYVFEEIGHCIVYESDIDTAST